MDAVATIATALALGAAAGLSETAAKAVKDAYDALKHLITCRRADVDVVALESDPTSASARIALESQLREARAAEDVEILQCARLLLEVVSTQATQATDVIGVHLQEIRSASLAIEDVISSGNGVKVQRAVVDGGIDITRVRAGEATEGHPKR